MRSRRQGFILAAIVLAGATVTAMLALASLITPETVTGTPTKAELLQRIDRSVGEGFEVAARLDNTDGEIHAALSLDTANLHAIIGSLQLPGRLEAIRIDPSTGLAYLANSFSGLQVVNIDNPKQPQIIGSLQVHGRAWDIEIRGNLLFLASAMEGLHIVDISNPKDPLVIAHFHPEGHAILKIDVSGQTIFASTGKKGLLVIDVSDITSPRLVKTLCTDEGSWGLLVDGNRLYVSCGHHQLEIYDISRTDEPHRLGTVGLPDFVWNMAIHGQTLFMPIYKGDLVLADVSDPTAPELLTTPFHIPATDYIDHQGDRVYIASRLGQLNILDVSDPTASRLIGTYELPIRVRGITANVDTLLISGGVHGLQVLDPKELSENPSVTSLLAPGAALMQSVSIEGYFYLATKREGLKVLTRTPSGRPGKIVTTLALPEEALDMVRIGQHLFLSSVHGLLIVDISVPEHPKLSSRFLEEDYIVDLVAYGNQLALATHDRGIIMVDTTDTEQPTILGVVPNNQPEQVAFKEPLLFVASSLSGLHIIDLQNMQTPVEVGHFPFPWPLNNFVDIKRIAIDERSAYLAAGPAGLFSFDISNPEKPKLREVLYLDGPCSTVRISANRVIAATGQRRLWVLQLNADGLLRQRAVINSLGNGNDIIDDGDQFEIINAEEGLTIIPEPWMGTITRAGTPAGRSDGIVRIKIPPVQTPGVYNLSLFSDGKLSEFVGAVTLH